MKKGKKDGTKFDPYQAITDKVIDLLEQGTVPWVKPWSTVPPLSIRGTGYRGINHFILSCAPYTDNRWLTFKEISARGGHVIKGEKHWPVVFFKWITKEQSDGTTEGSTFPILVYYRVFNVEQTEGLELPPVETIEGGEFTPVESAEAIVADMPSPPKVETKGQQACYIPSTDTVEMPAKERFRNEESYYSVKLHELVHSTGHKSRLDRKEVSAPQPFGSADYSKEELVAEMGAAYLCGRAGILETTIDNSVSYIDGWLSKLRKDKKLLVIAAAQAQKAADYILNVKYEEENSTE